MAQEILNEQIDKMKNQVKVLKEVEKTYPTSSIGNIITQIESRIKTLEQ